MTIQNLSDYAEGDQEAIRKYIDDISFLSVKWDRVVPEEDGVLIYGWLYSFNKVDFVLASVVFQEDEHYCVYTTSSKKATEMIGERLGTYNTLCIKYDDFMK